MAALLAVRNDRSVRCSSSVAASLQMIASR